MTRWNDSKIVLRDIDIPYHWQERLVAEGKIGGVFLVFLEGYTKKELQIKSKQVKDFCKTIHSPKI